MGSMTLRGWKLIRGRNLEGNMAIENKHVLVVYFSPAGSTRHVAKVMEKKFEALGTEISSYDLCGQKDVTQKINRQTQRLTNNSCLVIGSPVYVSRAVPPVMQFISDLVENTGALAVPVGDILASTTP